MPFGKHAGMVLADLPGNDLAWFVREGFPEGELGQLLELMHTIDHNDLRGVLEPVREGGLDDLEDVCLADATMERDRNGEEAVLDTAEVRKSIASDQ